MDVQHRCRRLQGVHVGAVEKVGRGLELRPDLHRYPEMIGGRRNDFVAAVISIEGVFSAEECARIRGLAAALPESGVGVYPEPSSLQRRASTRVIPPGEPA